MRDGRFAPRREVLGGKRRPEIAIVLSAYTTPRIRNSAVKLRLLGLPRFQSAAPTFTGPHVAVMGGWNQNQDKKVLTGTGNDSEKKGGVVVQGAIGYDHAIGDLGIIGAELGIATGGRAVTTNSGGSTYRTDPNISFDATARAGVKPIDNLLLFGKAGWSMQRVGTRLATPTGTLTSKDTEHGFLWGGGAELSVHQNVSLRVDFDRVSFSDHYARNRVLGGLNFRF